MKALKKQNKMLFNMVKRPGSRCELNKIKNIRAKESREYGSSNSNISISDSDSWLSSNSEWDERINPD